MLANGVNVIVQARRRWYRQSELETEFPSSSSRSLFTPMRIRFVIMLLLGVLLIHGNVLKAARLASTDQSVPADQPCEESEEETELELEKVDWLIAGHLADPIATVFELVVTRATDDVSLIHEPVTHGPNCGRAPPRD